MAAVALDLATKTGVATWYSGTAAPVFSTLHLPSDPGLVARPMEKLRAHLADLHAIEPIEYLFFEVAILPQPKVQDGRAVMRTTTDTVYKLCALAGMAEWFAHRIGAKCRSVEQQSWRKHFTGRGTGKSADLKAAAIQAAKMRGWNVTTDHEADALGVLDYGLACMNVTTPWRDAHLMGGGMGSAA